MSQEFPLTAHILTDGINEEVFVRIGEVVHVSRWYGYDIRNVAAMTVTAARLQWKETKARMGRYQVEVMTREVGMKFLGLDGSKLA